MVQQFGGAGGAVCKEKDCDRSKNYVVEDSGYRMGVVELEGHLPTE
jgi:hypothetical protein